MSYHKRYSDEHISETKEREIESTVTYNKLIDIMNPG